MRRADGSHCHSTAERGDRQPDISHGNIHTRLRSDSDAQRGANSHGKPDHAGRCQRVTDPRTPAADCDTGDGGNPNARPNARAGGNRRSCDQRP
jgi:hypothetical protein